MSNAANNAPPSWWQGGSFWSPQDLEAAMQNYEILMQPAATQQNTPDVLPSAQHSSFFDTQHSFPRSRLPRPVPRLNAVEFVDSLEWLVNAQIAPEDRKCPFCWGEFGLAGILDEEDKEAVKSSNDKGKYEQATGYDIVSTSPEDEDADDGKDVDEPSKLNGSAMSEMQKRLVREVREEMGLDAVKKMATRKHYAVKLPCGHLFGHLCLVRMLKSGERACPKCRRAIVE